MNSFLFYREYRVDRRSTCCTGVKESQICNRSAVENSSHSVINGSRGCSYSRVQGERSHFRNCAYSRESVHILAAVPVASQKRSESSKIVAIAFDENFV